MKFDEKPVDLAGLVSYQDGSVVSREVVRKDTGTVTVFGFDVGQGLSEHTAPFDALVVVLDGQGRFRIDQTWVDVPKGSLLVLPANHPHAVMAQERFKMLLVMIRS